MPALTDNGRISVLILRFEAPMQSWGLRARWDERDTATEPTKSGIIGLLGSALGYKRDDKRLEIELDNQLSIGIRVDHPGIIDRDYHTVHFETMQKADGAKERDRTIVSKRYYLEDSSFLVVIQGVKSLLEKLEKALKNPKWPVYLGRRACIPTRPVLEKLSSDYRSMEEALEKEPWSSSCYPDVETTGQLRCVVEDLGGNMSQLDQFKVNPARMYGSRRYREYFINNPANIPDKGEKEDVSI